MWTDRHRTRHEARLKDMVLQTGLDEVARFLERADPPGRPEATPARRVLAAIAWHLRGGGAWRALPADFPPWCTVCGWFRRWIDKGLFESLMRALARRQRRRCGRRSEPRLVIIDTQSVKCISVRGPRTEPDARRALPSRRGREAACPGGETRPRCWLRHRRSLPRRFGPVRPCQPGGPIPPSLRCRPTERLTTATWRLEPMPGRPRRVTSRRVPSGRLCREADNNPPIHDYSVIHVVPR